MDAGLVAERVDEVRRRIARVATAPVSIVAVTKGFGPDAVAAARAVGLTDVGENFAQELVAKRREDEASGASALAWHFLGAIQTNKVRVLAPMVDCWQSVWREREAERIAVADPGATVLLQVGFASGAGRPGLSAEAVAALAIRATELGLRVEGLMAVAPRPPEEARAAFRTLRGLADQLGLPVRSMGMTEDLELAVAEGSTMVRVGRALFGDRPGREPRAASW